MKSRWRLVGPANLKRLRGPTRMPKARRMRPTGRAEAARGPMVSRREETLTPELWRMRSGVGLSLPAE